MTPNNWPDLLRALEDVFGDILRFEIESAGVAGPYVLQGSTLGVVADAGYIGSHNPYMAEVYRVEIGDRFRGIGPAVILNDAFVDEDRPENFEDRIPLAVAAIAHEFCHVLSVPGLCKPLPTEQRDFGSRLLRFNVSSRRVEDASPSSVAIMDSGHDWRFVRMLLHFAHRLEARGWYCPLAMAVPWEFYGLSSPWGYRAELGDEPERMAWLSLSHVEHTTPPAGFMALYRADVARNAADLEAAA